MEVLQKSLEQTRAKRGAKATDDEASDDEAKPKRTTRRKRSAA